MNDDSEPLKWTYRYTVDEVVKKWSHLHWIYQYYDEYQLIKYLRKDSPIMAIKWKIPQKEAVQLIARLSLAPTPSPIFRYSTSWRKEKHRILLSGK